MKKTKAPISPTVKSDVIDKKQKSSQNTNKIAKKHANLNNIIEVTEEHYTHRLNEESSETVGLNTKKPKKNLMRRSLECLKTIIPCLKASQQISMVVREDQIVRTIQKLKNQKLSHKPYLPPLVTKKKTLVIDLDGTLLFSTFTEPQTYDFCSSLPYRSSQVKVYTKLRFGVESFLFQMSKIYEIVLYTARKELYTTKMIEQIDKKHWISHILLKQKCITLNKVYCLKSMKALGRNPNQIVFIDHDPISGILQPQNFCQIKCFSGEKNDRELIKIVPFLRDLANKKSVVPVYKHYEQFRNKQIQLQFLNLSTQTSQQNSVTTRKKTLKMLKEINSNKDRSLDKQNFEISEIEDSLQKKKRKYGHKKTNSQVQSLAKKIQDQEETAENQQSGYALRVRQENQL